MSDAPHGEKALVRMHEGRYAIRAVEAELRARLAQLGPLLRGGEHGDVEDLGRPEQLLRRRDHAAVLVDRRAKLLLQVTDAVALPVNNGGKASSSSPPSRSSGQCRRGGVQDCWVYC